VLLFPVTSFACCNEGPALAVAKSRLDLQWSEEPVPRFNRRARLVRMLPLDECGERTNFSQMVRRGKKSKSRGNNNPPRTLEPKKFFEDIFASGRRAERVKNSKSKKPIVLRNKFI
jgi:hypothetical protein